MSRSRVDIEATYTLAEFVSKKLSLSQEVLPLIKYLLHAKSLIIDLQ